MNLFRLCRPAAISMVCVQNFKRTFKKPLKRIFSGFRKKNVLECPSHEK